MKTRMIAAGLAASLLMHGPLVTGASAQNASQTATPDPRLSGPTIAALQSLLTLREAEIKAVMQDMQAKLAAREKDWAEYGAPLWRAPTASDPAGPVAAPPPAEPPPAATAAAPEAAGAPAAEPSK